MSQQTVGVGLLGAGPVVQAIHLPTLARLADRFTVRHIMDVDDSVARAVASRVDAASSTTVEELLDDPAVEVVAICSPPRFHAEQTIAALQAGKRAVLCEKPFVTSRAEAEEVARVSTKTGVPVLVGAMHTFDPGWTSVIPHWGDLPESAHTIRSNIVLPPNPSYEDLATQVQGRVPPQPPRGEIAPERRAKSVKDGVLGLAIHDLPLIRTFLPDITDLHVHSSERLAPSGYGITLSAGGRNVLLTASTNWGWKTRWELEVIADDQTLHVDFTPSYVQAGSATAMLTARDGSARVFGPYPFNGYEGEWRAMYRVAVGEPSAAPRLATLVDDITFAVDIAEAAAATILARGGIA